MTSSAALLRAIYPRVLARTLGVTRSLPEAEDAVQEAVVRALSVWPERGLPDAPEAWLTKVATRVHLDRARKARRSTSAEPAALETLAAMSPWIQSAVAAPDVARGFKDELLRLVFACCHPSLEPGEAAGLCLAAVVGLSLHEIAAAFTVEPRTMEQRLTRARRRLRERGDLDHRTPEQSREHLPAVLMVVHLLFNEGYWSTQSDTPIVAEL